ncbi:uncharacterized protein LOC124276534 [Haliotis rubra]|uniref:uncharacterized protein LOC124276534 n=1 Tax=Haliotis rubra TaxID=36100 RepID=UPI001EE55909|nr:uncharacterized protein LOC124276534 [Haliotis rubra]
MAVCRCIHVVCALLMFRSVIAATTASSNTTTNVTTVTTALNSTTVTTATTADAGTCEFFLTNSKTRDELSEALKSGIRMIKYNVRFKRYPADILLAKGGDLFRPNLWIRSTSRQGQSLLMLDDNFEMLSLSLLGIGVVLMNVELDEKPSGCMNQLTSVERENMTRYMVFNDFKLPGPGEKSESLSKGERICNMRIVPIDDTANFVYHCCHIDPDGQEICEDVHRDVWINVLLICIILIKVLVVLYSPLFVPDTFYRKKFTATEYVYNIPQDKKKKKIKIVKTMYPGSYTSENPPIRLEELEGLEYMKLSLNSLQVDKIYDLKLHRIQLLVKARKLLSETYVPVSVTKMIYENIFRCKMRNLPSLKPCCDTGICGVIDVGCKVLTWFRCLRIFAKMILIGLLAVPWIIRLVMYFTYEAVIVEEKNAAADRFQTGMHFHGSFTLYLTPLHGLFVAIYIIVSIDSFAYGLLGKTMKNRFKFILRKCLRDMRERSRLSAYGWAVALALLPFKRFGLVGFFLVPLYWIILLPIMIPILAFYTFPALNLSIRLIIHLFLFMCPNKVLDRFNKMSENMANVKNNLNLKDIGDEEEFQGKENMSKKEVCIQLCIIIMCLTSFWSLTFLLMECLSFFVEVGVYTLMGIIVNAGATLQYVTVIFLIGMYAKNAFGGVHAKYLAYHKIIRGQLLGRKQDEMKKTARQEADVQENSVFRVQSSYNAADNTSGIGIEVKDGSLRWKTEGLLVFLSSMDQPFTPEKFFFETINMNYCGCPGKLWQNTVNAFYNFMKIMVFLFFVVIVVLAFGNQFSTTNQMLATLAGGFVPFVFRNFFMKGGASFTVDTGSIQFVTEFERTIAAFTQKWFVSDIIPASITEAGVPLESADEVKPEEKEGRGDESEIVNADNNNAENKDTIPLVETNVTNEANDIRLEIESDDSEMDETKVDLIIDIARFDKLNRRIGMEGSLVNVGSLSMLADGNASIYRSPRQTNALVV